MTPTWRKQLDLVECLLESAEAHHAARGGERIPFLLEAAHDFTLLALCGRVPRDRAERTARQRAIDAVERRFEGDAKEFAGWLFRPAWYRLSQVAARNAWIPDHRSGPPTQ